jgi:hypothetical protein
MTQLGRYLAVLFLAGGIWSHPAVGQENGGNFDPVTMDPPSPDSISPARWEDLTFQSRGSRIADRCDTLHGRRTGTTPYRCAHSRLPG